MRSVTKLDNDIYVSLYSELAGYILEYSSSDPIFEIDENGDEVYTEEKQDQFNDISDKVCEILESHNIVDERTWDKE